MDSLDNFNLLYTASKSNLIHLNDKKSFNKLKRAGSDEKKPKKSEDKRKPITKITNVQNGNGNINTINNIAVNANVNISVNPTILLKEKKSAARYDKVIKPHNSSSSTSKIDKSYTNTSTGSNGSKIIFNKKQK